MDEKKDLGGTTTEDFQSRLENRLEGLSKGLGILEHVKTVRDQLGDDLAKYLLLLKVEPISNQMRDRDRRWFVFGVGRQREFAEEVFRIRYDGDDGAVVAGPGFEDSSGALTKTQSKFIMTLVLEALDKMVQMLAEDKGAEASGVERFIPPCPAPAP